MIVAETDRLRIRWFTSEDAEFVLKLVNEPSWIANIGDKGVRTVADAQNYLLNGPLNMYERLGFGLYRTELKETGEPIGMCGLIKRDTLEDVDIGYAFLPAYWGKGYAREAAKAVLAYGKETVGLKRLVAITSVDNHSSANLLEKLGMQDEGLIRMADDAEELRLFGISL